MTPGSCLSYCLVKAFLFFMVPLVVMCVGSKRLKEQQVASGGQIAASVGDQSDRDTDEADRGLDGQGLPVGGADDVEMVPEHAEVLRPVLELHEPAEELGEGAPDDYAPGQAD